jgi:hypothetical protein
LSAANLAEREMGANPNKHHSLKRCGVGFAVERGRRKEPRMDTNGREWINFWVDILNMIPGVSIPYVNVPFC